MLASIKKISEEFLNECKTKRVRIISHHDTDGITSATILAKTLKKLNIDFSIRIIKQLEVEMLDSLLSKDDVNIFLDLGAGAIDYLSKCNFKIFILDHHEIRQKPESNIRIINPNLFDEENLSGSSLTYLFSKSIDKENKELANLAIIGMVGDMLEKNISKIGNTILEDAKEVIIKKGPLIFSATRPLHKALEFSSSIYIPGVTGSSQGALKLIREAKIEWKAGEYRSIIDLNEEEMSRLITAILIRRNGRNDIENIIGNIYLIKFFNKIEDVRELSSLINACSRLENPETAILLCMGNKKAREKAEKLHASYKQSIISALNTVASMEKIEGKKYIIINAQDRIKDTVIGTIASILSNSSLYEEGTVIIAMAYFDEKIKISSRICGRNGQNLFELMERAVGKVCGEYGGHPFAAGGIIDKNKEVEFIKNLQKELEIEIVKI